MLKRTIGLLWAALAACVLSAVVGVSAHLPILLGLAILSAILVTAALWSERTDEALVEREHSRALLFEKQLERQKEAVDALADGLNVAIFICSRDGTVEYANQYAVEMFSISDPVGRSILAVTLTHALERLIRQSIERNELLTEELEMGRNGSIAAQVRVWAEQKKQPRVFISIYDVTVVRHLERVRSDFVANVSHELQTPLTNIRGMAEVMQDSKDSDPELSERYLAKTIIEVDRLSRIVGDLLTLSVAESHQSQRDICDLGAIVRDIADKLRPDAELKHLELVRLAPDTFEAMANPVQMSQVVRNLIENAINYTVNGSVTVELTEEDGCAVLKVSDTGIGISSDHLPRIFERFYRVDKGRSRESGGTGLGLSIVRHIVESHGGEAFAESMLNRGTTVTVRIPRGLDEADQSDFEAGMS